jgi:hypothetical protein
VIAVTCFATGAILDVVAHVRREAKRLVYLQHASPAEAARGFQLTDHAVVARRSAS